MECHGDHTGRANAPIAVVGNLLDVQLIYHLDTVLIGELARATSETEPHVSSIIFCFLTRCSIATRVHTIGVKHFRDALDDDWTGQQHRDDDNFNRQHDMLKLSQNLNIGD